MSKKSQRNQNQQHGKTERAHDGYLPSMEPSEDVDANGPVMVRPPKRMEPTQGVPDRG